ncbi:hypothetical protein GDO78_016065 [Eleutherodactylus coqui]|uniref:Uncharacterized protein n=1 Tax=Eleutherodactylus coqui TaxID=57060 RepID=A0A8J6K2I2_ELECQ|nr:hypothetical protein GDO78_016065 [Eleutherodactylus coqui]
MSSADFLLINGLPERRWFDMYPLYFNCLSQQQMLFVCGGCSLKTRLFSLHTGLQILILLATKHTALSFKLSPSCVLITMDMQSN